MVVVLIRLVASVHSWIVFDLLARISARMLARFLSRVVLSLEVKSVRRVWYSHLRSAIAVDAQALIDVRPILVASVTVAVILCETHILRKYVIHISDVFPIFGI